MSKWKCRHRKEKPLTSDQQDPQLQGTKDIKCVCGISAGQGMVMVANSVETAIHMLRNIAMGKPSTL
jgi:hypothetical protein